MTPIRFLIPLLILLLPAETTWSQRSVTTGDQSPILRATRSQIAYYNQSEVAHPIPAELVPLLAGLLITNQVQQAECQAALETWIAKYRQLDTAINSITEPDRAARARRALRRGDFPAVESMLSLRLDYEDLPDRFPNVFGGSRTQGDQSPIVYAEVADISYVMQRVIHYQLPEQLTTELLRQLQFERSRGNDLADQLKGRDQIIAEWILKYREAERQLQRSPEVISRRAYAYFAAGRLDSTLLALRELDGSREQLAQGCYLQAKIQMLRFDPIHYDSLAQDINRLLLQAQSLSEDYEIHKAYGFFLAETIFNYPQAYAVLQRAKQLTTDPLEHILLESELGYVQGNLQNHGVMEKHARETLRMIEVYPEKKDTNILNCQNQSLGILANAYFQQGMSNLTLNKPPDAPINKRAIWLIRQAIAYDSLCLGIADTMDRYCASPDKWRQPNRFLILGNLANRTRMVEDFATADQVFRSVLAYMDSTYAANPALLGWRYVNALNYYADFLMRGQFPDRAEQIYRRAKAIVDEYPLGRNVGTFYGLQQNYLQLARILKFNRQPAAALGVMDTLAQHLAAYSAEQLPNMASLHSNIDYDRAYLALRLGQSAAAIEYAENVLRHFLDMPVPTAQHIQVSTFNVLQHAWTGAMAYLEADRFAEAEDFLLRVRPLIERLRSVDPRAQRFLDISLIELETIGPMIRIGAQDWSEANRQLSALLVRAERARQFEPLQTLSAVILIRSLLAEVAIERGDQQVAETQLRTVLSILEKEIDPAFQGNYMSYYCRVLIDLLDQDIGKKKEREVWANQLRQIVSKARLPSSEIFIFHTGNQLLLDNNRLLVANALAVLAEYDYQLPKSSRPSRLSICNSIDIGALMLPIQSTDKRHQRARAALDQARDRCRCSSLR